MAEFKEWYIDTYQQNVMHALQQKESKLENTVTHKKCEGEKTRFHYIGTRDMEEITEDFGDTKLTKSDFDTRWAYQKLYGDAFYTDVDDIENAFTDPTSDMTRSGVFAANRCKDRCILNALGANAMTGHDADIPVAFPSSQILDIQTGSPAAAAANQGLNLTNLKDAACWFDGLELDPDDTRYMLITAKQKRQLLDSVELTSRDYTPVLALYENRIDTFLGFKFIMINLLPLDSGIRTCWAYTKNSVGFVPGKGLTVKSGEVALKNFNRVTQLKIKHGAVRILDKGVLQVPCAE